MPTGVQRRRASGSRGAPGKLEGTEAREERPGGAGARPGRRWSRWWRASGRCGRPEGRSGDGAPWEERSKEAGRRERAGARDGEEDAGEDEGVGRERRRKGEGEIGSRDPIANRKDLSVRWRDLNRKRRNKGRVVARTQGLEQKTARGRIRVWRLGGLGPVWATLSQFSKHFYFANLIWHINFRKRRRPSR